MPAFLNPYVKVYSPVLHPYYGSVTCECRCASSATLDGGLGLLLPMQEKTYRRLLMLQNALNTMLPHHAGLNPKAFRYTHMKHHL